MTLRVRAEDVNDVFRGEVYGEDDIFTEPSLRDFIYRNDVDLRLSPSMMEDGELIGLMLVGRRGTRTWFGALGVLPELRGEGFGRKIFREGLERVRAMGATSIEFEVVQRNAVAVALYRSFAFETIDELFVWARSPRRTVRTRLTFRRRSEREIRQIARPSATCWQREARSVARAESSALIETPGAYAFVRMRGENAIVLDADARDEASGLALLHELDRRVAQDLTLLNEPSSTPLTRALRRSRWRIIDRQHRMRLSL